MKKIIFILPFFLVSCYTRIADLNVISNRNYESNANYVLIKRDVTAKANTKRRDALEISIDKAVEKYEGEHMRNVKIYISATHIKVEGDVWGLKKDTIQ